MEKTTYIDVSKKEIKGLALDDKITVELSGTIVGLDAPREFSAEEKKRRKQDGFVMNDPTGSLRLKITKQVIVSGANEFTQLSKMEGK